MTDEEFVYAWINRKTGLEFQKKYRDLSARVFILLANPPLPTCDPVEGVGECSCGPGKLGQDVRFYISDDEFLGICVRCDSWAVWPTAKKKRRDRGFA